MINYYWEIYCCDKKLLCSTCISIVMIKLFLKQKTLVKEVKHNEVEVECKECENGQQQEKLNSTEMEG